MTLTTSLKPSRLTRAHVGDASHRLAHSDRLGGDTLGRYTDLQGRLRELVARPGYAGTALVLDRDAVTFGDRRLVAHLGAEEPRENARIVCRHYLQDPHGRWCRPVTAEDLRSVPEPTIEPVSATATEAATEFATEAATEIATEATVELGSDALFDTYGCARYLGLVQGSLAIPELRWLMASEEAELRAPQPVSLREVVGSLESYEPARTLTVRALARHRTDSAISVAVLRAELARLDASRIVLNRGLRRAVLDATRTRELSMSEIAVRCGRIKYDARGNVSGETSWLARRVGIAPEGGERTPTPWVHSEVLGLIARAGLGISPREVELG